MTRRLDPIQQAAAKRAARCPDCDSDVKLTGDRVSVYHDDGCPALAALRRQGRTSSIAVVPGAGQSPEEYAADIVAVAEAMAAKLGPVVVRQPYTGLYGGEAS